MAMGSSAPACDQIDSPQRRSRSCGRTGCVVRAAEGPGGLRCPYCRYRCTAVFSLQIHVCQQHPVHCEDLSVGRLGKAVFYQPTAKLFHCHICFFTSKDHVVVLDHLLVSHCCVHTTEGREQEPEQEPKGHEHHTSGVDAGTSRRSSVSNAQDEDGDVNSGLQQTPGAYQQTPGAYQCPYCGFRCSLSDLQQHLSECETLERNRDRGETGTEEDEEEHE